MPENPSDLPDFTTWPSFPFEGDFRVKGLEPPVDVEPPRSGEDGVDCVACHAPDYAYIWVSERWRVKATDEPPGLPVVLVLESRSHLDLGDLPNLHAAELGVMTVRLERAIRSLDGVGRVHVNRWGDGSAHLHLVFQARPYGHMQLRGSFLSLWEDILPPVPRLQWQEDLGLIAAWLAEFGGQAIAEPPHIAWQAPGTMAELPDEQVATDAVAATSEASAETAGAAATMEAAEPTPVGVAGAAVVAGAAGTVEAAEAVVVPEAAVAAAQAEATASQVRPQDLADLEAAADPTLRDDGEADSGGVRAGGAGAEADRAMSGPQRHIAAVPATRRPVDDDMPLAEQPTDAPGSADANR